MDIGGYKDEELIDTEDIRKKIEMPKAHHGEYNFNAPQLPEIARYLRGQKHIVRNESGNPKTYVLTRGTIILNTREKRVSLHNIPEPIAEGLVALLQQKQEQSGVQQHV